MYRPSPLVHSFLILALSAFVLPLCAQQEAAPPDAAAMEAPLPPEQAPRANRQEPGQAAPQYRIGRDRRDQVEMRLRAMMSDFGIDNATKQDAVIAYLAEDEAGKSKVREAGKRLLQALRRGTEKGRTRDLIAVYKGALDADKERRVAAQTALDAKIGFSLEPRLEAALWLFGVLGEGQVGLSINSLIPRPNANQGRNYAPQYGGPLAALTPRAGTVFGTVSNKGEGWIEVGERNKRNSLERYIPFWAAATVGGAENTMGGGYDRAVLEAMRNVKVGDSVRLEWVWSERKRVVKLEPWTPPVAEAPNAPAATPENIAPNAPTYGGDQAPQDIPQQP